MIDIKEFYSKACQALSKDFPALTEKQQTKIIDRYVNAVTDEVNSTLRKFVMVNNRYTVNLTKIHRLSRGSVNGKQEYMHSWFNDNCPLFAVLYKGNGIHKKLTEIKMYYNIKIKIDLLYLDAVKDQITDITDAIKTLYTDEHFEVLSSGDESKMDIVPIDMRNLQKYITRSEESKHLYNEDVIDNRIREAKRIYSIAKCFDGNLIQIIKESEFGRKYYRGPNLQSAHKDIRHAALGDCIEYDIENSVYSWRYTEAKAIAPEKKFPCTIDYLDRKEMWREDLAEITFKNVQLSDEMKLKLIKQVFTAISFGAKGVQKAVFWNDGNTAKTYAINDLIKNADDRKNFFDNAFVKEFLEEQKEITDIIYKHYTSIIDFNEVDIVKVKGRVSQNKVMSLLYQQQERKLLDTVIGHFEPSNVLLTVHDAFYIKRSDSQAILNARADLSSYNTELKLEKNIPDSKWVLTENTDEHKAMINSQEQYANGYKEVHDHFMSLNDAQ